MEDKNVRADITNESINDFRKGQRVNNFLRDKSRAEISGVSTIFAFIFVLAVIMMLFRLFLNPNAPIFTFDYFLDYFKNHVISIDMSWLTNLSTGITADWGLFNWFKDFLNFIWKPISFVVWFSLGIVQLLLYIFSLIGYFFGLV